MNDALEPSRQHDTLRCFGFEDESWQSKLANAVAVRLPDAPGGYQLLRKIGEGGQGTVYQARQLSTGRLVAAKRLFGGRAASFDRFEREIQVLSDLTHPSIVSVIAAERDREQRWLILEWVDGPAVDHWAQSLGSSPEAIRAILALFIEICNGVQHAHSRGVIHRDIKPSNILVDAGSRPHILDFGIAKLVNERVGEPQTLTGSVLGTLGYSAPEQLIGDTVVVTPDIRVDVYSLGAVLYKLFTGKDPLSAVCGSNPTTAQAFRTATEIRVPPRPSASNPRISRDLDAIILKALHPNSESRYATVDALRSDVHSFLFNRPVTAQPPTRRYLARVFIRRQRLAVSVAAIAVLLITSLTVFLSILSWQLSRRTDELAISAHNAQRQQHIALDLAEKRKVTAQSLATMVQSLASTYSSDATMDTLDARLREAAEMVKSGMLDDDVDTLMLMHRSLGGTLMARGMLRESLFHHQKYAELAAAKYGAISRQVAMALNSQTAALDRLGDYAAAEVTARRSIQIDTQLQAKGASPRSAYISNLASILHAQGKFREAEELYRHRLASLIAEANEPRERIARAKRNISLELFSQGKIQEAESLVLEAIEDLKPASTTQIEIEDDLLRSYRNLALIRQQQGRLEEAERLQRQVVQGMIGLYGAKHTHLLQERVHLASILLSSGAQHPEKRGEAIMLLRDTESLYKDRVYPGSEHLVALRRLRQAHEPQ